jgi:hypothetical protein
VVRRAGKRAFPHPTLSAIPRNKLTDDERHKLKEWDRLHVWSPNALRHAIGTRIRDVGGVEASQVALAIRRTALAKRTWQTASIESLLGGCLPRARRFTEAEPLMISAVEVFAKDLTAPRARHRESLTRIVGLYELWNDPQEAARWRENRMDVAFPPDPFAR